eukprot:TRINITY_DN10847_c4_g1_i1.p1 TRINITY_DN10847_c4_g1~~TRINITY_DN10847_c4_g1_i1.p1  ORF type:complete len:540 (+),score=87.57 TRINITY_DN10847_c4_g1_i1:67-1686(+)
MSLLLSVLATLAATQCDTILLNNPDLESRIKLHLGFDLPTNPTCRDVFQIAPFVCSEQTFQSTCCGDCLSESSNKKVLRVGGPNRSVPPFWEYDDTKIGNERFSGFFFAYLMELMKNLGAEIEVVPLPFPLFITGATLFSGEADVTPTWLSAYHYSSATLSAVELSIPVIEVEHKILVRKYESDGGMWGIFDPYTTELWLLICGGILASAFVFWLVESRYASKMTRTPSGAFGALYFALTTLMIGGEGYEVVTWLGRFLRIGTLFYVLIIQSTYTANLASILTAKTIKSDGPTTLEEAQNSIICCPYGKADPSCHNDLWISPPDDITGAQEGIDWCTEKLQTKVVDGVMADALSLAALLSTNCASFKLSGISFNPTMMSLATPASNSDVIRGLNVAIVETKFTGRYSDLFEQYHPAECPEYVDEGEEAVVGISHMSGLFIIFACVCALVVCLWIGRMILENVGIMEPRKTTDIVALPDQLILEAATETRTAVEELAARQAAFEKELKVHLNMSFDDKDNSSNSRPCLTKCSPDSDCGSV